MGHPVIGNSRLVPLMRGKSFGVQTVVADGLSVIYTTRPLMRATFSGTRWKPHWENFVARP